MSDKDEESESEVIEGEGPERVVVNESEQEPPYGTTD
jgi:hypothetical protein